MKKKIGLILLLVVSLLITGCSLFNSNETKEEEKEVSNEQVIKEEGYTITVSKDFEKKEIDGFDTFYQNEKIGFTSLREPFETLASININKDSTLAEYGEKIIEANKILNTFKPSKDESYMYTTYEKFVTSQAFYYYTVVKKGTDSFWLFNFFCRKSDKDQELANIEKYAATLKVD